MQVQQSVNRWRTVCGQGSHSTGIAPGAGMNDKGNSSVFSVLWSFNVLILAASVFFSSRNFAIAFVSGHLLFILAMNIPNRIFCYCCVLFHNIGNFNKGSLNMFKCGLNGFIEVNRLETIYMDENSVALQCSKIMLQLTPGYLWLSICRFFCRMWLQIICRRPTSSWISLFSWNMSKIFQRKFILRSWNS